MGNEAKTDRQKARNAYKDFNRGESEVYRENIKTLDNQILALSAGTLGLSLTFVSDLVNLQTALLMPLLIVSWALLAAAVLSVLFGLRFATRIGTMRDTLDGGQQLFGLGDYTESGPDPEAASTRAIARNNHIEIYNRSSVWFFVFGLAAMIVFISVNVLSVDNAIGSFPGLFMLNV